MTENHTSDDFKAFEQQYMQDNEGEIVSVYDRHAGLVDGAAWKEQQYDKAKQEIHQSMSEALAKYVVTAELDDVAQEYIRIVLPRFDKHFPVKSNEIAAAIFFGANWQREQMMKEAVDGEVYESVDPDSVWVMQDGWVSSKERGLVAGDRVKLIIVKEDRRMKERVPRKRKKWLSSGDIIQPSHTARTKSAATRSHRPPRCRGA